MFIYFHKNKFFGNEKGQLAPLFIVIIVVLVIMAFVTVNLSKVGTVKTESSNAADAAALAGGSVMASVFNSIAQANSEIYARWVEFQVTAASLFATAEILLLAGIADLYASCASAVAADTTAAGCFGVCAASGESLYANVLSTLARDLITSMYVSTIMSLVVLITAYSIKAYYNYQLIRDMAEKGRNSARKIAFQFAFMNSGIGAKLKEGVAADDIADPDARRNYRDEFSSFMKNFNEDTYTPPDELTYSWKDGQNRSHHVKVRLTVDEVDTFNLKITVLPWEAEEALLMLGTQVVIMFLYQVGAALYMIGCVCQSCCNNPWTAAFCCPCWWGFCAAALALMYAGIILNELAIVQAEATWAALLVALAGLTPGPTHRDDSGNVLWATICWIEDVDHDRRFTVDTWQHHEGTDTGLWQVNYPDTHSYSLVDFTGTGKIKPPVDLHHDSTIIATDVIGSSAGPDPFLDCPTVTREAEQIDNEIASLNRAEAEYEDQARQFDGLVVVYRQQGVGQASIDSMVALAEEARMRAQNARDQAQDASGRKSELMEAYAQCF